MLAISIWRFRTPVWSVNVPTAVAWLDSGTGGTVAFRPNLETKRRMRGNRNIKFCDIKRQRLDRSECFRGDI